jgi:ribosomal protein L18E
MFSIVGCNSTEASMTKDIVNCLSTCKNMKNNVSLEKIKRVLSLIKVVKDA